MFVINLQPPAGAKLKLRRNRGSEGLAANYDLKLDAPELRRQARNLGGDRVPLSELGYYRTSNIIFHFSGSSVRLISRLDFVYLHCVK
jgi:hypothetical protein